MYSYSEHTVCLSVCLPLPPYIISYHTQYESIPPIHPSGTSTNAPSQLLHFERHHEESNEDKRKINKIEQEKKKKNEKMEIEKNQAKASLVYRIEAFEKEKEKRRLTSCLDPNLLLLLTTRLAISPQQRAFFALTQILSNPITLQLCAPTTL